MGRSHSAIRSQSRLKCPPSAPFGPIGADDGNQDPEPAALVREAMDCLCASTSAKRYRNLLPSLRYRGPSPSQRYRSRVRRPILQRHAGLLQGREQALVQQLGAQATIEALNKDILGRLCKNYIVEITDWQTTAGTNYSGWCFVAEWSSNTVVNNSRIEWYDVVIKLLRVSRTASIAFSDNDIVITV